MAKVPLKPEVFASKVLVIFRLPVSRVMELVTVTVTAAAALPLTMVAGLPSTDGVPKVQPVGAVGRVGSETEQLMPVSKGPTVVSAPAARLTVTSLPPQL